MTTINVDIVSAGGSIYAGVATMVFVPAEMGELGIAPRHAPLLTKLKPGAVRVQAADGTMHSFFVGGGIVEIQPNLVIVLADSALRAGDADEAAAQAAKARAEAELGNAKTDIDLAKAQTELIEAAARLKFVQDLKKTSH